MVSDHCHGYMARCIACNAEETIQSLTDDIHAIDYGYFYEKFHDADLVSRGEEPIFNPLPIDPIDARDRLMRRRALEAIHG